MNFYSITYSVEKISKLEGLNISAIDDTSTTRNILPSSQLFSKIENGHYKAIYVSPEKLLVSDEWEQLKKSKFFLQKVRAIVVDEAHCIDTWGRSFRPQWGNIGMIRATFPKVPIMALSATLSHRVRKIVIESLHLRNNFLFIQRPLDRPNIFFGVQKMQHSLASRKDLVFLLSKSFADTSAVLFVESQTEIPKTVIFHDSIRECKETVDWLNAVFYKELHLKNVFLHSFSPANNPVQGIIAETFHSNLSEASKSQRIARFQSGRTRILCATEAFGMGMDIPDIKRVIVLGIVNTEGHKLTLETLIQRFGRAGRDQNIRAEAILLAPSQYFQKGKYSNFYKST